jgi:hypothetical protein
VFVTSQLEYDERSFGIKDKRYGRGDKGIKERQERVQSKDMEETIFPIIFHVSYTHDKTELVSMFVTYFHTKCHISNSSCPLDVAQQRHYLCSTKSFFSMNLFSH